MSGSKGKIQDSRRSLKNLPRVVGVVIDDYHFNAYAWISHLVHSVEPNTVIALLDCKYNNYFEEIVSERDDIYLRIVKSIDQDFKLPHHARKRLDAAIWSLGSYVKLHRGTLLLFPNRRGEKYTHRILDSVVAAEVFSIDYHMITEKEGE